MLPVRQLLLDYITALEQSSAAGAVNVSGTGRLRPYTAILEQLAAQVPTLTALASLNRRFVEAHERDAGAILLDLLGHARTLRTALLGNVTSAEPLHALPDSGPWATPLRVDELVTVLKQTRRSGHRREALQQGSQQTPLDLRLLNEWIRDAVTTSYHIPDLPMDVLIPAYGTAVIPDLNDDFFQESELSKARRLVGLCRLDPAAGRAAVLEEHPELANYLEEANHPIYWDEDSNTDAERPTM